MWNPFRKREPTYSEIGSLIHKSLREQPDEWRLLSTNDPYYDGLLNERIGIRIEPGYSMIGRFRRGIAGGGGLPNDTFDDELTKDDRKRLIRLTQELIEARRAGAKRTFTERLEKSVLSMDATARALAKQVLEDGDMIAARMLADRVQEIANGD